MDQGSETIKTKIDSNFGTGTVDLVVTFSEDDWKGGPHQRLWWDTCDFLGEPLQTVMRACEGGQEHNEVENATAAAVCTRFEMAAPVNLSKTGVTILVPLTSSKKQKLEGLVKQVQSSELKDTQIKFGKVNEKQEFKTDKVWGKVLNLGNLVLVPISNSKFTVDFTLFGVVDIPDAPYYFVNIQGCAIDVVNGEKVLEGEYAESSQKFAVKINTTDASVING